MDPVDPKRRGRGLFGRRRHEHAAEEPMDEPTTVQDAPDPGGSHDPAPVPSAIEASEAGAGPPALGTLAADGPEPDVPVDEVELLDEISVVVDSDPETGADVPVPEPEGDGHESGAAVTSGNPTPIATEPPSAADDTVSRADGSTATAEESSGPTEVNSAAATPVGVEPTAAPGSEDSPSGAAEDTGADSAEEAEAEGSDEDEAEPYDLPRILAIANQKGGVGKTTTSVNLGAALAEMGYRVLVVDLDPQGNATTGLGVNARELEGSVYDVIMNDAPVEDCVEPTSLKNLFVVPATIDLAGAEIELVPAFSRELKLRRALHEMRDDYDYMIIDCPPSLGLLTVNGLAAADDVVVPIQCEYYALEGLSQLIRNVSLVQKNLNPSLSVRGIVLTMYDARTKLADQVEQEVRNHFGRTVYQTVVPRTVRLSEAPSFGQPIILFDPTSRGAVAYRELAKEVSSGATRRTG
jgi:chromosome partitioning protein